MNDSTQTKDLHNVLRFIIMQQQSGRMDPTRARKAWQVALTDQEVHVVSKVMAELIFKMTRDESL
ncbi:hypothetical protein ACIUTW_000584 [Escherichia coli]